MVHNIVLCSDARYTKGTQERGHVLGAVDDIVLSLDDNAMNLQSMAASRFVGPFLDKVQKWEKSLSHISEVVEVRGGLGVVCFVFRGQGRPCGLVLVLDMDGGAAQVDVP